MTTRSAAAAPVVGERTVDPHQPLTMTEETLLRAVDTMREELFKLVGDLVSIDSRNDSALHYRDRNEIFAFVERYLQSCGFDSTRYEAPFPHAPGGLTYPNLIASTNGDGPGPTLQFCGHLDAVDFALEDWDPETPPLAGVVKHGRLYGRGAADMKAGVACQLVAARLFREAGAPFRGRLQLWFTPDEETHGAYGSAYMTRHHFEVVNADATIIAEASAMPPLTTPVLSVSEKGVLWLRLTFHGASGHGSRPKPRSNPIHKAGRFIAEMDSLRLPQIRRPIAALDMARALLGRYRVSDLARLVGGYKAHRSTSDRDGLPLAALFRTTASVGCIRGGRMVNVIPDRCVVELDVRTLPGVTAQEVLAAVADYCTRLGFRVGLPEGFRHDPDPRPPAAPVDVAVSIISHGAGSRSDPGSDFGRLLGSAFEAVYRVRASHFMAFGFTDAGRMREAGVRDVFVLGPRGGEFHAANEYCDLDSVVDVTKVFLLTAHRYLRGGESPDRS